MTRRSLLALPAAKLLARPRVTRELFRASPAEGIAVFGHAWYTNATGGAMFSIEQPFSRSGTVDAAFH